MTAELCLITIILPSSIRVKYNSYYFGHYFQWEWHRVGNACNCTHSWRAHRCDFHFNTNGHILPTIKIKMSGAVTCIMRKLFVWFGIWFMHLSDKQVWNKAGIYRCKFEQPKWPYINKRSGYIDFTEHSHCWEGNSCWSYQWVIFGYYGDNIIAFCLIATFFLKIKTATRLPTWSIRHQNK